MRWRSNWPSNSSSEGLEAGGGACAAPRLPRIDAGMSATAIRSASPELCASSTTRQLAKIARPVVSRQGGDRGGGEAGAAAAAARIGPLEKMLGEQRQFVEPLAERRDAENKRGDRVV